MSIVIVVFALGWRSVEFVFSCALMAFAMTTTTTKTTTATKMTAIMKTTNSDSTLDEKL